MENIFKILQSNTYPGRGIILGGGQDGSSAILAYFIMGRSENSRNRVFVPDGSGLRTRAHDPARLADPSLIIYSPIRTFQGHTIVTNGDQTDTIYDCLSSGQSFQAALRAREFEPDEPNYTPRISGLLGPDGAYVLSILKSDGGDPRRCLRFFFEYDRPAPGRGHFISTYLRDGSPLPSYTGEPLAIQIQGSFENFAGRLWGSLNPDNRVSLLVGEVDLETGERRDIIFNKNEGD